MSRLAVPEINSMKLLGKMVGAARFELTTP